MAAESLTALLQRSSIEDHEEVLNACNAALAKSKTDIHAQHVKVVALLKLDRYEDALRVLEEAGDALKSRAAFEYAYALYKCGHLEEAADVAARLTERGPQHVLAQASYRAENFETAAKVYKALSEHPELGNESNDLRINTWATEAQAVWKRRAAWLQPRRPTREDLEAFETAYNAACLSLARGDFRQGEVLLKRAKELCKTSEYLSAEEKTAELLPIMVQEIYALIMQEKFDQAEELANEISVDEISELSTRTIAKNNILLARKSDTNPFALFKEFHDTPTPQGNDKLFEFQDHIMKSNAYAVDMLVQKFDGIVRSTNKALSRRPYPSASPSDTLLSVYNAAAHVRGKTGRQAIDVVKELVNKRPKDIGLALTLAQLYVGIGNISLAVATLQNVTRQLEESISEADQDVRFSPGLVSALIVLYKLDGRKHHIPEELRKAAAYWRQRPHPPHSILCAAAVSLLRSSEPADLSTSQELFDLIREQNPEDKFATAGYIAAYATSDLSKIQDQLDALPSAQELVKDVDVSALESEGIPPVETSAAVLAGARKRAARKEEGRVKKRVRKSRLPKDYDPNKTPDPERWLPLRERSTYRPKGRKAKQRAAERTQGGIVPEQSDNRASPSPAPAQKAGGASKKKKKGKR